MREISCYHNIVHTVNKKLNSDKAYRICSFSHTLPFQSDRIMNPPQLHLELRPCRAEYPIQGSSPFKLVVYWGSVVEFAYPNPMKSAIVNAANNHCLGGHGVDGAISVADGEALLHDRHALPIIHGTNSRCMTGNAVITGPNNYMHLRTPFVIHTVGPSYSNNKYEEARKRVTSSCTMHT